MRVRVAYVTGHVTNLPWWRALAMTDEEIKVYNDRFLRYDTVEFEMPEWREE